MDKHLDYSRGSQYNSPLIAEWCAFITTQNHKFLATGVTFLKIIVVSKIKNL